jgi:ATP-dependent protease HslVU (ClpYQ) peptidase subunit
MTVAIGLVCSDGVLVASDSMGSSGRLAAPIRKVQALEDAPAVWTYAGSLFMGQAIEAALASSETNCAHPSSSDLVAAISPALRDAYRTPTVPPGGTQKDLLPHATDVLLLTWHDGEPSFSRIQQDLTIVNCHRDTLVAIGSGNEYASVVRAALAHYIDGSVDLHLGMMLAYRVISTVCDVSAWNVAPPVQIAVADASGARVLTGSEVDELADLCSRWVAVERSSLGQARDLAVGGIEGDLPSLPSRNQMDHTEVV